MEKMKLFRSLMCIMLALALTLSLGACGKKSATILDDSEAEYADDDYGYDEDTDDSGDNDQTEGSSDKNKNGKSKSSKSNGKSANGDTDEDETTDNSAGKSSTGKKTTTVKKKTSTGNSGSGNTGTQTGNKTNEIKNDDGFNPYEEKLKSVKGKKVKFLVSWTINSKSNAFEQKVIDNMKKDLGIELKPVTVSADLYQTKLTSMIASGDSPDLCIMLSTDFPMMILKNKLQKIDTSVIDVKNDSELSIPTMNLFKWGDDYYGINCGGNWQGGPFFVYYNKTLIQQKGYKTPLQLYNSGDWNWDTFAELAKNMTDKSKNFYGFGCESTCQVAFLDSIKTDFVKFSGKNIINNLNDQNLVKALSFVSDLRSNGYMEPSESGGTVDTRAMTLRGSWLLQNQYYKDCYGDNGEIVPVPCPKGQKKTVACQPRVICVCRGAKQPVAASYAARYFCDPDNYDMTSEIKSKQMREMFYSASKSNDMYGSVGVGVVQYDDPQAYWNLLYLTKYSKEDIVVNLKKNVSVVDGVISKIQSDSKVFN